MTADMRRCPKCQAVNPQQAEECSLCGESLAEEAEVEREVRYGLVRAQGGLVRSTAQRPRVVAHAADPVYERSVARAMGVGALAGAGLFLLVGLIGGLPLLGRLVAVIVPSLPVGGFASVTRMQVPSLLSLLATGIITGGLVGAVASLVRRPEAGAAVAAVLFVLLRIWGLRLEWAGVGWYDKSYPLIYGTALGAAAAAVGGFFGYAVALVVHRNLRPARPGGTK